MTHPDVVQGFLDVSGHFDAPLAWLLASALVTSSIGFHYVLRQPRPIYEGSFHLPVAQAIDAPLVAGAALFGAGWGLTGYCPGPAIASLAMPDAHSAWFVATMLTGMALHRLRTRIPGR